METIFKAKQGKALLHGDLLRKISTSLYPRADKLLPEVFRVYADEL
jgi:hypothetical protein